MTEKQSLPIGGAFKCNLVSAYQCSDGKKLMGIFVERWNRVAILDFSMNVVLPHRTILYTSPGPNRIDNSFSLCSSCELHKHTQPASQHTFLIRAPTPPQPRFSVASRISLLAIQTTSGQAQCIVVEEEDKKIWIENLQSVFVPDTEKKEK